MGLQVKVLLPDWQVAGQGSCLGAEGGSIEAPLFPTIPLSRPLGLGPEAPPTAACHHPLPAPAADTPVSWGFGKRAWPACADSTEAWVNCEWFYASVSPPKIQKCGPCLVLAPPHPPAQNGTKQTTREEHALGKKSPIRSLGSDFPWGLVWVTTPLWASVFSYINEHSELEDLCGLVYLKISDTKLELSVHCNFFLLFLSKKKH